MENSILKQIAILLTERKKHRRWLIAFTCMAVVVSVGTVAALRMMGQAMTQKVKVLDCRLEVHKHVPECYDESGKLICGYADYVVHMHNEDCYAADGGLTCRLPEIEAHKHTDECYTEQNILVCPEEESEGHRHTEECYTRQQAELLCQIPEHAHEAGCYDENGVLLCGQEEHMHSENCYRWDEVLSCQAEEGAGAHTHTPECYEQQRILSCGKLELHVHTDECYEKNTGDAKSDKAGDAGEDKERGRLICEIPQLEEHIHSEEFGCFQIVEIMVGAEGEQTAATEGNETDKADKTEAEKEEQTEADKAKEEAEEKEIQEGNRGESGAVPEESAKPDITRTYKGEGYIVTAVYSEEADIPEEAEFIAEQITPENNSEHYAEREAAFKESMEDEGAAMKGLFKIGFYVNGEEVEPKSAVSITIQLLDANGMPDGTPITVIHFADAGTEMLDGGNAKSGSTTFEMDSFSEVAIGYRSEEMAPVYISEVYEYERDAFRITFHIEGETMPLRTKADDKSGQEETNTENAEADKTGEAVDGEETVLTAQSGTADEGLEFKVKPLERGSEEYKAFAAYAAPEDGSELLQVQAFSYALNYEGVQMDLSKCEVTAEITPTEILTEHAEASIPEAVSYLRENSGELPVESEGEEEPVLSEEEQEELKKLEEEETEIIIAAAEVSGDARVNALGNIILNKDSANGTMTMKLKENTVAVSASKSANPDFTVQYYAKLNVVAGEGTHALPIIDTDNGGNGAGGKLPENGRGTNDSPNTNPIRSLYVDDNGNVQMEREKLTEVYRQRAYKYIKAPTLKYFDALIDKEGYRLSEVWVSKHTHSDACYELDEEGKRGELICTEADNMDKNQWDVYPYNSNLHITNREVSASEEYIWIKQDSILRLVYDVNTAKSDFAAAFYDYDISDGSIYKSANDAIKRDNQVSTAQQTNSSVWYAHTKEMGINHPDNYSGDGTKLGFGNINTGTTLGGNSWNGNLLNKNNGDSGSHTYKGCTFGLADSLADGKIQYADGVLAPNLFNDGDARGKRSYSDYSLKFNRDGDTYTLAAVNGTDVNGLESFNHPSPYAGKIHDHIWTNNFWPMDSAPSYGAEGHDLKFGSYSGRDKTAYAGSNKKGEEGSTSGSKKIFPYSDDGQNHNSYFGMNYQVEFDLSEDYVGPLEYYFFGDDDMWVFLDGRLVCDIGGVHSSVGEYVNLWDYLEKGSSGKHTLSFYYTERGASGSTCWMQFTLPSASSIAPPTTDKDYGHLRIDKTVLEVNGDTQSEKENEDEFSFRLWLTDENGNNLKDDFAYTIYDKNRQEVDSDIIVWDSTVADGEEFTLKGGQYIIIDYLPKGTRYKVIEEGITKADADTVYFTEIEIDGTKVKENIENDLEKVAEGSIGSAATSTVSYRNKYRVYELPETGGNGLILYTIAGVLCVLTGAGFMYRKKVRERRV